jgi:hypothetical protein
MTKEEIKSKYLDVIAAKIKDQWHGQATHRLAVGAWWMDAMGVKDQAKRAELLKAWDACPSSFGANCSALGQALGRESTKSKIEKTFEGI